eukprot:5135463-Karenia_brevis.AAC.1
MKSLRKACVVLCGWDVGRLVVVSSIRKIRCIAIEVTTYYHWQFGLSSNLAENCPKHVCRSVSRVVVNVSVGPAVHIES